MELTICPSVRKVKYKPGCTNADSIVEDNTKRFVDLLATFAAIEEVLLDIINDREQGAACLVSSSVLAVRASNTPGQGSYEGALY